MINWYSTKFPTTTNVLLAGHDEIPREEKPPLSLFQKSINKQSSSLILTDIHDAQRPRLDIIKTSQSP